MGVKDRIAIVTGAGSGIGKAIAETLAKHNAKVILFDLNKKNSEEVAIALQKLGHHAIAIQGDVTKWDDVERTVDFAVDMYGRLDILVNSTELTLDNQGFVGPEEEFDFIMNVNLKGNWLISKAALKYMKVQEHGRIVNISSQAFLGSPGQSKYAVSKGGVISLTRSLALEFAKYYVTVNCIAPGLIDTPLIRTLEPEIQEKLMKTQPTPMIGQPYDIANCARFLASEEARYITGQIIYIDGGISLAVSNIYPIPE